MIKSMITGIKTKFPQMMQLGVEMLLSFTSGITSHMDNILSTAGEIIQTFVLSIASALPGVMTAGFQLLGSFVSGILRGLPNIIDAAITAIQNFIMGFSSNLPAIIETGAEMIVSLNVGIIKSIPKVMLAVHNLIGVLIKAILNTDWIEVRLLMGYKEKDKVDATQYGVEATWLY